jgi:hypothetical protein
MKGRIGGVLNLVKVAEEVLQGRIVRKAELRKFSNNSKIGYFRLTFLA